MYHGNFAVLPDKDGGGEIGDSIQLRQCLFSPLRSAYRHSRDQHGIPDMEPLLECTNATATTGEIGAAFIGQCDDLHTFTLILIIKPAEEACFVHAVRAPGAHDLNQ